MTVEKVICDECGRAKGESNHWHKIGVYTWPAVQGGMKSLILGETIEPPSVDGDDYEIHDLCGESCFYKHIAKLLKMNPVSEEKI